MTLSADFYMIVGRDASARRADCGIRGRARARTEGLRMECRCAGGDRKAPPVDLALIEPYLAGLRESGGGQGDLIAALQRAQELYGYLPEEALGRIGERLRVKPAKLLSVVTFYTQFRTRPIGKHLILLCQGTACHVNGSPAIEGAIQSALGVKEGDISEDGLFTYENVACLGCCSLAPVMMIGERAFGALTREKTARILKDIAREESAP